MLPFKDLTNHTLKSPQLQVYGNTMVTTGSCTEADHYTGVLGLITF